MELEHTLLLNAQRSSNLTAFAFLVALGLLLSRIIANRNAPRCLTKKLDLLVALKVLFGVTYIAATTTILAYVRKEDASGLQSTLASVAAIAFVAASVSEHYRSIAPSTLTTLYAIFGSVFYAYEAWGLYEILAPRVYLYAHCAAATSLLTLVILESKSKRSLLLSNGPPPVYESTLSFLVKPFFPHLLPLLYIGSKRRIKLPELRDIPLELTAAPATEQLLAALATGDKTSKYYLVKSTFNVFGGQLLSPILPRLVMIAATFAQVTLVEQMILYVSDTSIPKQRGRFLMSGYFVVYVSLAISNYVYAEKINAFVVLYGSALTGSMYAKTLRLTSMAARDVGQGAATTYMSVDVQRVTNGFQRLQESWAALVTIAVACMMLWQKAVFVMFAPLLFIITLLVLTSTVGTFVGAAQKAWLAALDIRIKLLTSVLGQLLPIKLGAYEAPLESKIHSLRKIEAQALKRFMYLISLAGTMSIIGSSASFLVTLAAYAVMFANGWGDLPPLDVSRVFTLFTIVNILGEPLAVVGQALPTLFASYASLGRIQGFLQLPEKAESEHGSNAALVDLSDSPAKDATVQVSLEGCTFSWDDKTQVLHDITLNLSPCELHMVVGSVASGKSSLLMSILQETILVQGTVKVNAHKIALASQTPFIFPGTFRANILLDSPFDAAFYDKVIDACGLRQDIEALPHRNLVKLGDKGTTLSGGQRQRLALARAVYARADLVLLDDVFSALDGKTEAHVFASLFGPDGMLKGKTTILVTHGVHHLPSADKVIVMASGTIIHFGSFAEVRDAGGAFALASPATDTDTSKQQVTVLDNATEATVVDEEKEEEEAWVSDQTPRGSAYMFYAKCTGFFGTGCLLLIIAAESAVGIFSPAYLSMLASSSGSRLGLWVAGYGGLLMSMDLFSCLGFASLLVYASYLLSTYTAPNIHAAELAGIMGSPISWITKNPVGRILNRYSILGVIGTFVFIMLATPLLAFALPFLAVLGFYAMGFYIVTSNQFRRLELASKSPLYTLFGTTVSGLITVRAYRTQDYFRAQNALFVDESQGALHHRLAGQLFLRVFLMWFQTILGCSIAVLTVLLRDTTSASFLGIALSRLVTLGFSLSFLLTCYAGLENGGVAIARIEEYANLAPEEKNDHSSETKLDALSAWPSSGSLVFSDFSMRYREDLPQALKNLSFEVNGGLKIGICGRTGSGKSSTVLSLFRGIDQHLVTGKILIDGVDISTIPLKKLRQSSSIVTQDPFLWHGSIRENLDINNERTDAEIWEALEHVGMHDAVSALDDKLDHLVVDEESFSKGQRQLLCQSVYNRHGIAIDWDDSMDHITDEKIRHVVNSQMKGFTVIAIAHRISTIVNYDKILVLDKGSIAEFDDPTVLLSNPESRFARLAATQGIYHPDFVPSGAAVKELGDGKVMVVTEDLVGI
ncbi:P-loop containing nucleoside triphosphate hydrolase protein [Mycena metata]|uniref:P-loop containing nucleoside triphosphate hydrolase protein n=1 Tax=Mycena metata TaxID=1033252 RepID=A0AAD7I3B5_9AGAR|nr:P-loop containing nucleoside triphosphate hydrolase protein [Mycena metata]